MTTQELAHAFTELCKAGKFDDAGKRFWSEDIVSIEPMTGEMAMLKGRKAVEAKGAWWAANHEVHSISVEGPFTNGEQFALRFALDVTPKGKARMSMTEVGLYTLKDGKVVEERFFFGG